MKIPALVLALAGALAVAGCSQQDAATPVAAGTPAQSYDAVIAQGKGFTVGTLMSANTVYVLFDPQCPHCGHLWEAARPLLGKTKFVWIPVSIINGNSAPQGAALLAAANPLDAMTAHEASILAGTGGTPASGSLTPEAEATIKKNTELFTRLKLESVPFIVTKSASSGQIVTHSGALDTPALASLLGLNPP